MTSRQPTEWDAATYHRVSRPHETWGQGVLARLPLRGDDTVLDAGCGTGKLTAELLERLPSGRVVALDASANMLDAARDFLAPRFGDRVTFVQADLLDLDRSGALAGGVDAVFSTATFHWVRDHARLFANLFRVLRPGGWLVAQCGGGANIARLVGHADDVMRSAPFAPYFAGWGGPWEYADDATTAERLRTAGFVEVETSLEPSPVQLGGRAEYAEYLRTVVFSAHLARLPEDLRAPFVEAVVRAAEAGDPPYLLDYWRLNIRARMPG